MVTRRFLHDLQCLIYAGIERNLEFDKHTNFFIRNSRIDYRLIADHTIGNNDPAVLKVFDHGMTQGNILDITGVTGAYPYPVAYAEWLEDDEEYATDDIGKCRLRSETDDRCEDACTCKQRRSERMESRYGSENDNDGDQEYDEVDGILEEVISRWIDLKLHRCLAEKASDDQAHNAPNYKGNKQHRYSKNYLLPKVIHAAHKPENSKLFTP
jgi:hypothetical protein